MKKIFMTGAIALSVLSLSVTAHAAGQSDYALAKAINTQTDAQLHAEQNPEMEYIKITRSNRLYEEIWHDRTNLFGRTDTYQIDGKIGQSHYLLGGGKRQVTIKYPSINVVRTFGKVENFDPKVAQVNQNALKQSYIEQLAAEFTWKDTGEIFVLPDGKKSRKKTASKTIANGVVTSTLYVDPATNFPLQQEVTWDTVAPGQGGHRITHETREFARLQGVYYSLFMLPTNITLKE
ncbi:hypothetical protein ACTID9_14980 [Brevibacillus fluminis]|uniref:hypothetical protein n=1 Tax=Brevibacillus fluminis TaxID=511487 RepID=UPI003F8AC74F